MWSMMEAVCKTVGAGGERVGRWAFQKGLINVGFLQA